ncbi:MAG: DUF4268 domain-containing protein [Deltaproteobacteria bacterium]|jgi:hypothetical protein|nr:DUF4268 domain-containing protein [Deltaproteobacteria bacterium]
MNKKPIYNPNSIRNQNHLRFWRYLKGKYATVVKRNPLPKHDLIINTSVPGVSLRFASIPSRGLNGDSRVGCSVYFSGNIEIASLVYDMIKKSHKKEVEEGLSGYGVEWRDSAKKDRQVRIYHQGCTLNEDEFEACARWMMDEARPLMLKVIEPLVVRYHQARKLEMKKAA